jgi:methionine biosynthesis protein MetW
VQQDLEGGLALFEDQSFDKVILSQTLQTIHQTARILSEIARVGKECVVSFPNFGHWSHRSAVLLGRMPVSKSLPYQWYDTPNVRVLTIADFHDGQSVEFLPNLRGSLAVYRARRAK